MITWGYWDINSSDYGRKQKSVEINRKQSFTAWWRPASRLRKFANDNKVTIVSPQVKESKIVLDFGLHAVDSGFHGTGFRIPRIGFRILCQWNLDSRFQSLAGSGFLELYSGIPIPRILPVPKENISLVPETGFHYMGRIVSPCTAALSPQGWGGGVALSKLTTMKIRWYGHWKGQRKCP